MDHSLKLLLAKCPSFEQEKKIRLTSLSLFDLILLVFHYSLSNNLNLTIDSVLVCIRFNTVCIHLCQNFLLTASMKGHCKMELPSMKGNRLALIFLGQSQIALCSFMCRYGSDQIDRIY